MTRAHSSRVTCNPDKLNLRAGSDRGRRVSVDIAAWLHSLGMQQYEAAFRDNAIDERVLPNLTAEDLKDLGVSLVGHRRRLLDAVTPASADAPTSAPAERRQLTVVF